MACNLECFLLKHIAVRKRQPRARSCGWGLPISAAAGPAGPASTAAARAGPADERRSHLAAGVPCEIRRYAGGCC